MKIGFFDSGLGGLSIFNKTIKNINADYIYLADTKNVPYGVKDKREVMGYILENIKILVNLNCDIIVIACNTATSIAIETLRSMYNNIPIIGTEPAVKVAADANKFNQKILVSATTITLNEYKLNNLIKNLKVEDLVEKVALDKLVEFAEQGEKNNDVIKEYLNSKFKKYDLNEFGYLVLGCTHFPIFEKQIKEVVPANVNIVDGSNGVVQNIYRKIKENNLNENKESLVELLITKEDNRFVNQFRNLSGLENFNVNILDDNCNSIQRLNKI